MRIQHPRATDAYARDPPSNVAVRVGGTRYTTVAVDDDGYLSIKPEKTDDVMDDLESSYNVEYDRETGEIVGAGSDDDPDVSDGDETEGDDDDGGDLEAWANWNEDDWLSLGYQSRQDDVEDGLVDEHLEEIIKIETSSNVEDAAKTRLEELEG